MFNIKNLWFDFWGKKDEYKSNILNSILFRIDKILYKTISTNAATPPVSPVDGEIVRVMAGATGRFQGKEDYLAFYYNNSWRLIAPQEGFNFYDKTVGKFLYYNGSHWVNVSECYADHNKLHNYDEHEHEDWGEPGPYLIDRERINDIAQVKIGNLHGESGYVEIDGEGHLTLHRDATVFDDLRFPFTRDKQGQNDKPDFDYTNIGLLLPQNDATEIVYIICQFQHSRKLDSDVFPHIHFNQTSATTPTFKMDYRWYNCGEDPTVTFTTVTFDSFIFTYTSGIINQIAYVGGGIDGSSIDKISSIMECKIYRDDDVVGDVLTKEFDIHYEIDSMGSNTEYVK